MWGSRQFLADFFNSDIMNHCEFLKHIMTQLGKHDEILLEALLERIASDTPVTSIAPFYAGHQDLPKNPLNIAKAYVSLKTLKVHAFNIYEASFLDIEKASLFMVGLFTVVLQCGIFSILVSYNLPRFQVEMSRDATVWLLALSTTFFFSKACYDQFAAASEFKDAFEKIGRGISDEPMFYDGHKFNTKKVMMLCSVLGNQIVAALIPIFNLFFILLSEDPNNAILNSVALFFVLQLDEMVMPPWDESRILDELAINAHDFIMIPQYESSDGLAVKKQGSPKFLAGVTNTSPKMYAVYPKKGKDGSWTIVFYHRNDNGAQYEKNQYTISGTRADEFIETVQDFECFAGGGHYGDIHD